ncbi:MAG: beta-lactamase family protein [Planctomycetes bacterium]|jgi:CubicO group peptidase (beta-lactamase class C family)|nr:beta-lactamase family protein [Planctomycetota bacterium]
MRWVLDVAVWTGLLVGFGGPVQAAIPQTGCYKRPDLDPKIEAVIDEFRATVPEIMDRGNIPGAALALVDDKGIVWTEGFGYSGGKKKPAVTPDTPFMLCGLTKLLTATAVMLAVQDGLVKLDEPVTTYLPGFTIRSRYEDHPERKITLRRLLNYTAGLPIEVPVGNYFEPASTASFEKHVKSLWGSWLVCPVGSSFYHSSAASDLAAYIVQVVSGQPYEQYLARKLFTPLGMSHSTADSRAILKDSQRAIGQMTGIAKLPSAFPALGAAGVYSSARDMARLVQLHINRGTLDGRNVLDGALIDAIHTPVGIAKTEPNVHYGMGVYVDRRAPARTEQMLWHDGWGFGFLSLMHWYPEYGLGAVVLTNKLPNPVLTELGLTLTDKLVQGRLVEKRFPRPLPDGRSGLGAWWGWSGHQPTPYDRRWRPYCGTHNLRFSEYSLEWWAHVLVILRGREEFTPRIQVREHDGFLCVTESKFFEQVASFRSVDEKLQEVTPGVFMTRGGGTLDFTRDIPTWCNYRLQEP